MSPSERVLWQKIQRRAAFLNPEIAAAILLAFAAIRDELTEEQVTRIVELGFVDRLFEQVLSRAVLSAAFFPVREKIRTGVAQSFRFVARDLPKAPRGNTLTVAFDFLNPRVTDAVVRLETRVIADLELSLRATIRAAVEQGLRGGVGPRTIARGLRSSIGLGPTQLQEVENFRDALLGRNGRSLADYTLRNRRFDTASTPEQIERAVETYRKARIAQNAETVARTASLDAQKLGQRLAFEDAVEKGIVDGERLRKKWIGVMDLRERDSHKAMQGDDAAYNEPYRNGQMDPGDTEYNCRCVSRFYQTAA